MITVGAVKHVSVSAFPLSLASSKASAGLEGSSPPPCTLRNIADTVNIDIVVVCVWSAIGASTALKCGEHAARDCLVGAWNPLGTGKGSHRGYLAKRTKSLPLGGDGVVVDEGRSVEVRQAGNVVHACK